MPRLATSTITCCETAREMEVGQHSMKDEPFPSLVLVVGPGRSGTSMLAGMLRQLGCEILLPEFPGSLANPLGYSESRWVYDFHEKLLESASVRYLSCSEVADFDAAQSLGLTSLPSLVARLSEESAPLLLIKDPRTTYFTEVWEAAATELGRRVKYLIITRNPGDVVSSQNRYYDLKSSTTDRLDAWSFTSIMAERITRDHSRLILSYENTVNCASQVAAAIAAFLDIKQSSRSKLAADSVVNDLHRLRTGMAALDVSLEVAERAINTYCCLVRLSDGDVHAPAVLDHIAMSAGWLRAVQ